MTPGDVARAALCTDEEYAIVDRAEEIACAFAGIDPRRGLDDMGPENVEEAARHGYKVPPEFLTRIEKK